MSAGTVHMRPGGKNKLLKVVILGDGGVGKSCLMNRFVSNQFDEHSFHTIGVEFLNKDLEVDGKNYILQIWDTAGQERFRTLRTPFYRGSDVCMLTYAVDDRSSFRNLNLWKKEFLHYADIKESAQFPFLIVGNKCDVPDSEQEVTRDELENWCRENDINSYIITSAKNAVNVQEAFSLAIQQWIKFEKRADKNEISYNDTIDLKEKENNNHRSCCARSDNGSI